MIEKRRHSAARSNYRARYMGAIKLIDRMEQNNERGIIMNWIDASDELPEMTTRDGLCSDKLLIAQGVEDKHITFGWYRINQWVTSDMEPFARQDLITHWMPLPENP